MAMFKKTTSTPAGSGASHRVAAGESAISIIGPGMSIEGDLVTDGIVRVEGRIQGTVRAGKAVVLGKEGEIRGNVFTQDAVIGGRVIGVLVAESRLELQSTSVIEGEIRARAEHLQLDEGARFNGQIQMIDPEAPGKALPAPPPAPLEVEPTLEAAPEAQVVHKSRARTKPL